MTSRGLWLQAAAGDGRLLPVTRAAARQCERGGLRRLMDGGLLQVTWAGTSEPGWQLCVTSDSGHSKFRVLREPGLSDS